jgi:hypothetical protein
MEVDRRTLMKGMLAGVALSAFGFPPWTLGNPPARRPRHCLLLLGGTGADDMFANGARAACSGRTYDGLQMVTMKGGLLASTDRMVNLLAQTRGARWIAVMDDASAAIFLELARTAGVRLLSMGTHACSTDSSCQHRHAWATTSTAHSPAGLLASQLVEGEGSFSIIESFLHQPLEAGALTSWSAPGFSSYRFPEPEAIHIHCSGLSLSKGCELAGLAESERWLPIPPQVCGYESLRSQSTNWVESLGYAVTASALGVDSVRESCSGRAFAHQSRNSTQIQPTERFVSFVMDI